MPFTLTRHNTHALLKKKYKRSLSSVLKLKYPGDWLLKHGELRLIRAVLDNNNILCGHKIFFRRGALKRALLCSIRLNKATLLAQLVRISIPFDLCSNTEMIHILDNKTPFGAKKRLILPHLRRWICAVTPLKKKNTGLKLIRLACQLGLVRAIRLLHHWGFYYTYWRYDWNVLLQNTTVSDECCLAVFHACRGTVKDDDFVSVVYRGSEHMLMSLRREAPHVVLNDRMMTAALQSPTCMQLLHSWGCPICTDCLRVASHYGHLEAVKLLLTWGQCLDQSVMSAAVIGNHVHLLDFFNTQHADLSSKNLILKSAQYGSLDSLQWLFRQYPQHTNHRTLHDVLEAVPTWSEHARIRTFLTEKRATLPPPRLLQNHRCTMVSKLMATNGSTFNCPICFDDIDAQTVFMVECGHLFHNACLAQCPTSTCPVCRTPYTRELSEDVS